ncbi:MAG: MBL fold metallo-hydrolase [Pirellulales bacterium]|nr:MBL fold metallo-hydrolase [Pirellulales bacterium]
MAGTIGLVLLTMIAAAGGEVNPERYVQIERLSNRVVLGYWLGTGRCNLVAIRGEKGLAIIDTEMSPRIMAPIKARIERTFGRDDWLYVINTHGHMHHAGGNVLFPDATVVGHENLAEDTQWLIDKQTDPERKRRDLERAALTLRDLREALRQVAGQRTYTRRIHGEIKFWNLYIEDMKEGYEIVRPTLTFADTHTLDLGDVHLELVFFGKGHSLCDTLVYVPEEKLLVTGAIVYQRAHLPEVGERTEWADVQRFMTVLDRFLAPQVQIDRVISSHSPPLLKSDLRPVRDYYQRMVAGLSAARREGLTLEQATDRLAQRVAFRDFMEPPPGHWAYGMHERNIRNLWRILSEPSPGQSYRP